MVSFGLHVCRHCISFISRSEKIGCPEAWAKAVPSDEATYLAPTAEGEHSEEMVVEIEDLAEDVPRRIEVGRGAGSQGPGRSQGGGARETTRKRGRAEEECPAGATVGELEPDLVSPGTAVSSKSRKKSGTQEEVPHSGKDSPSARKGGAKKQAMGTQPRKSPRRAPPSEVARKGGAKKQTMETQPRKSPRRAAPSQAGAGKAAEVLEEPKTTVQGTERDLKKYTAKASKLASLLGKGKVPPQNPSSAPKSLSS